VALRYESGGRDLRAQWLVDSAGSLSLLLVEDDDVAAEAVIRGLHKHALECSVVVAQDGVEAFRILRGQHPERRIERPCIVLLDINMPRMNGFEFLRALRSDAELRRTVVFVLTTSGAASDRARAFDESVAGYIVKAAAGPQFSGLARFLAAYRSVVQLH
jgi:CheY-like chemotaxis protein